MINWITERLLPKYKLNKKETLILDVVTTLCTHSGTEIRMAPLTGRYFIVNKEFQYWIRVLPDGITITNHKFTFINTSPQGFQSMVIKIVENAIEKSRDEFESNVFQNEVQLLENIVSNIKSTK